MPVLAMDDTTLILTPISSAGSISDLIIFYSYTISKQGSGKHVPKFESSQKVGESAVIIPSSRNCFVFLSHPRNVNNMVAQTR